MKLLVSCLLVSCLSVSCLLVSCQWNCIIECTTVSSAVCAISSALGQGSCFYSSLDSCRRPSSSFEWTDVPIRETEKRRNEAEGKDC